ncbi:flavodoxin-dependent (E)-4-hydroxy-3-methylbut-2-enyl-diphosphate synthase [Streptomyces sp. NPDC005963]|uniref:flavodoxin-dependent (E)-4-hydroxy-3-methylbut-2-enyl-diphosphate synthase n=1 Tax=Streptomyces sp. NPDC005963 TaxID=3156721 RepID=UPI00340667A1
MAAALVESHGFGVTVEDNSRTGGIGSALAQACRNASIHTPKCALGLPRAFVPHGSRTDLLAAAGLDAAGITRAVLHELRAPAHLRVGLPAPPPPTPPGEPHDSRRARRARPLPQTPTRRIHVGNMPVGCDVPISVQTMTIAPTADVDATTLRQIAEVIAAGCDIVRVVDALLDEAPRLVGSPPDDPARQTR